MQAFQLQISSYPPRLASCLATDREKAQRFPSRSLWSLTGFETLLILAVRCVLFPFKRPDKDSTGLYRTFSAQAF